MPEEDGQGTETQNETQETVKTESTKVDSEIIREALKKEIEAKVIEKVRKEEKDKLYPEIEKLKGQLLEKESGLEEAQKAIKEYEEKNLTAEERTNKLLKELVETNESLQKQVESVRTDSEKQLRDMQLKAFKEKVIDSYKGKIIPDLISGASEEDIVASAEKSNQQFMEIWVLKERVELEEKLKTPVGTNINPGETHGKVKGVEMKDIDAIESNEEWQKVRKELLAKAGIKA